MKIQQAAPADLEPLVANLFLLKKQMEDAAGAFHEAQDALVRYMEIAQRKTLRDSQDGYIMQATYKQQTSVSIDESGLRKKMGAPRFDKYTVKKLDRRKLEADLDGNEELQLLVSPYVTTKKSKPFLQLTMKEDKSESSGTDDQ